MFKKLISSLLIMLLVLGTVPAAVFADSEDVPEYHGFVEALNFSCVNPNELLCPYEGSEFDKNKHEYNMVLTDTGFKNTQIIISEEHACEIEEEVVKEATETEPGLKKITATYTDEEGNVYTTTVEVVIPVKTSPETGLIISGIGVVGALGAAAYVFARKRKEDEE